MIPDPSRDGASPEAASAWRGAIIAFSLLLGAGAACAILGRVLGAW